MDNNFYEYRRETRTHKKKEQQKNPMVTVIIVQLIISLLISGLIFIISRNEGDLQKGISEFYAEISETDLTPREIIDVFKKVAKATFAPVLEDETATGETNTTPTGEKADFSPVYLTIKIQNPIEKGAITSKFGYRISPITKKYSLHSGLDIASPENSEIHCVYSGVVLIADENEARGKYLVIKHSNNLITTYNHCNELLVKEGEKIKKGETIALVGSTGWSTGPHLHFEIKLNDKYINPLWVLNYEV